MLSKLLIIPKILLTVNSCRLDGGCTILVRSQVLTSEHGNTLLYEIWPLAVKLHSIRRRQVHGCEWYALGLGCSVHLGGLKIQQFLIINSDVIYIYIYIF